MCVIIDTNADSEESERMDKEDRAYSSIPVENIFEHTVVVELQG